MEDLEWKNVYAPDNESPRLVYDPLIEQALGQPRAPLFISGMRRRADGDALGHGERFAHGRGERDYLFHDASARRRAWNERLEAPRSDPRSFTRSGAATYRRCAPRRACARALGRAQRGREAPSLRGRRLLLTSSRPAFA